MQYQYEYSHSGLNPDERESSDERWNSRVERRASGPVPVLWWLRWRGDDRDEIGGEDLFQDDQTGVGTVAGAAESNEK